MKKVTKITEDKVEEVLRQIDKLKPAFINPERNWVISFERLQAFMKQRCMCLFQIADFMYANKDKRYNKYNSYFKKVHRIIRKLANGSEPYRQNLYILNHNNFVDTSKQLNPKYSDIYVYYPMNYDQADEAYKRVLDFYDPNVNARPCWEGFWSLVETKNGRVIGVYLGDTMDRELFQDALKAVRKELKIKELK